MFVLCLSSVGHNPECISFNTTTQFLFTSTVLTGIQLEEISVI